mmetsp:Transcript_12087/g.42042  ORF Transcript_12087/g.42042 Transcript_12087/m.42042 type:complete len:98 (+) Transcript_12087:130-423(+)
MAARPKSAAPALTRRSDPRWRNSSEAKKDALEFTKETNLRIVLEHLTSELLLHKPDDPLSFMIELLRRTKEEEQQARDDLVCFFVTPLPLLALAPSP